MVEAGRTFKLLHVNELGERTLASPALVDGTWYWRTASTLRAIRYVNPARAGHLLGSADHFNWNVTSVGLPADTVTFCGAPFSASCHTRSS